MIPSSESNFLYLADCLPSKYPTFYRNFEKLLQESGVSFGFLPGCKDVWAKDFMPVQVSEHRFVQFIYHPDYLKSKTWQKTISNTGAICMNMGIKPIRADIILDGGNVVQSKDKVFMCEKVFQENPHYTRLELIAKLSELFETDKLYFLPLQNHDIFGHADGMLRFFDENTVLINDYSKEKPSFQRAFQKAVQASGVNTVVIPYHPYENQYHHQANGVYINYLEMENVVFLPIFGKKEDEQVIDIFETIFKNKTITTVDCNEIGNEGGLLNCISWNIKKCPLKHESFSREQWLKTGIERLETIGCEVREIQMDLLFKGRYKNFEDEIDPLMMMAISSISLKKSKDENVKRLEEIMSLIENTIQEFNTQIK